MDKNILLTAGSRAFWFIGQLLILFICIYYIEHTYFDNIRPDKIVAETYKDNECLIQQKGLSQRGRFVRSYRADFLLTYVVNETSYSAWTSANGLDRSFTTDKLSQESELNQFTVGVSYPCWYNPQSPQIVVLVLRHTWTSTFTLFIPSVIALIMLYYLFRSLFIFFGTASIKTRETIKKKKTNRI
jgi:hypothetical protein